MKKKNWSLFHQKNNYVLAAFVALLMTSGGCSNVASFDVPEKPAIANKIVTEAAPIVKPETTSEVEPDKGDNPSRIHQLRELEIVKVKVNKVVIDSWLMDDDSKRTEGMMFLKESDFKETQGMLFVFPDSDIRSFWMRNTFVPLDIIYVDRNKKVDSIVFGKPLIEVGLPSRGLAKYVLELKSGRAAKFGIKPGTQLEFPNLKSR